MPSPSHNTLIDRMDRRFYPELPSHWDDIAFRRLILDRVGAKSSVLDLGAGDGHNSAMSFRGAFARVCGIDPDPRVLENPFLDEAQIAFGDNIPYQNGTFDAVVADNVLEHLDSPELVFAEVSRVLRPGGLFFAKTPNRTHYVTIAAQITPDSFHRFYNRLRGRDEADTFPTRYRANTPAAIKKHSAHADLIVDSVHLIEGRPEYLRLSPVTYVPGILYERIVNSTPLLARLRVVLMVILRKRG
jgi:SAM-dependent methyltransferase